MVFRVRNVVVVMVVRIEFIMSCGLVLLEVINVRIVVVIFIVRSRMVLIFIS